MNSTGKRVIVFTMMWVILVMVVAQVYDNITGQGMPATQTADTGALAAGAAVTPDPDVQKLADLQTCVASNPNDLQCVTQLADFYYAAHQWDNARVNYVQAVRLNPHDAALLLKLAGTQIYLDMFDQAIPTLRQAAGLQPNAPEIHLLLGLSLSKLDPPQTTEAVSEWRKVLQLAPGSAWATQASQYISEAGQ